jgi:hypothetical protein
MSNLVRRYLAQETKIVRGNRCARRTFALLGTKDWAAAAKEVARLYERGSLPRMESLASTDNTAITVRFAAARYLQSRKDGSLNPIEQDTYDHYASLINQRLIPFCDDKGIVYIREFANKDVSSQFTESWRQLRRNTGELLAMTTRRTELERFRTSLRECVENDWMAKSGADKIKFKNQKTAKSEERYGLELEEYELLRRVHTCRFASANNERRQALKSSPAPHLLALVIPVSQVAGAETVWRAPRSYSWTGAPGQGHLRSRRCCPATSESLCKSQLVCVWNPARILGRRKKRGNNRCDNTWAAAR